MTLSNQQLAVLRRTCASTGAGDIAYLVTIPGIIRAKRAGNSIESKVALAIKDCSTSRHN
ncbi:MAG: hypothetical protein EAZ90_04210 [Oscillatoriales cyanobacterium]|nr:MAG: hypothetical protein EAZ94_13685 [Oscillatoriales cyanobacterium]TAE26312.1 MAG: hypothetical protein EAZ93_08290 [Oscillatoriales cyanobacterium]TAE44974.1 MAG: hypothetical protein EAZ90_04210 [Oscillatoriales cyanobacterium]TAE54458.1 MAG: hypothetical protein EAZ88_09050 [Oscillatoriales cyanobacterium]TAF92134.1 MAG: hypothetical protein EAZ49_02910 [Oscillatoriales cyanobacterium]